MIFKRNNQDYKIRYHDIFDGLEGILKLKDNYKLFHYNNIRGPPNLSNLTLIIFNVELTHLSSETSKLYTYEFIINLKK